MLESRCSASQEVNTAGEAITYLGPTKTIERNLFIGYLEVNRQVAVSDKERWPFKSLAIPNHMYKKNLIFPFQV